jgi:hypothetical protein
MPSNLYAFRADMKSRLGIAAADTDDDALIDAALLAASRGIDSWTGRQFFVTQQTRYLQAQHASELLLGADLLSVTSLKTDEDGDRTYETTWATTDYDLEPANGAQESPPRPYWRICTTPNGDYSFPIIPRGIEIVGGWGVYQVLETPASSGTAVTVAEILDTSETGVDVSAGSALKVGQTMLVDSEQMEITAISTNTLTVVRGINGTTAATHASGASVQVYTYPIVGEAALHQAGFTYRAKDAPMGVQGSPDFGAVMRAVGLHPLVLRLLEPFRIPVAA